VHDPLVEGRIAAITGDMRRRQSAFVERAGKQDKRLGLPHFPTTTIGLWAQGNRSGRKIPVPMLASARIPCAQA